MTRHEVLALGILFGSVGAVGALLGIIERNVEHNLSPRPPACPQYAAVQRLLQLDGKPPWLGMEDDAETLVLHFPRVTLTVGPDSVRWEADSTIGAYATSGPVPGAVRTAIRGGGQ